MKERTEDFFGFTGDPKHDNPRKRYLYRVLGADTFDDVDYFFEKETSEDEMNDEGRYGHLEEYDIRNDR